MVLFPSLRGENIFFSSRICSIFVHFVLKRCHSIAKRLIFQNVKKIEHIHGTVFVATARQRWITFFLTRTV